MLSKNRSPGVHSGTMPYDFQFDIMLGGIDRFLSGTTGDAGGVELRSSIHCQLTFDVRENGWSGYLGSANESVVLQSAVPFAG